MAYVNHPLIKKNKLEARIYQELIFAKAVKKSLLCVLPTGLGKTAIAIMLAAYKLKEMPDSKVLMLAPTKPLVEQHMHSFADIMDMDVSKMCITTGSIKPEKRKVLYENCNLIFSTPQVIKNDIERGRLRLNNFSLIIFDEAHHAIGNYAYVFIAKYYKKHGKKPHILGLTASPGGKREKIEEICKNLGIEDVEIRTERDEDVKPWVKRKDIEWVYVKLPESMKSIRELLMSVYKKELEKLKKFGLSKPINLVTRKDLLKLQKTVIENIEKGNKKAFFAITILTKAIKVEHGLELLETQGIKFLHEYFEKMKKEKSRAVFELLKNYNFVQAIKKTKELFEKGIIHPKIGMLCGIVEDALKKGQVKIIIFANYRSTVKELVEILKRIDNARPVVFVGQKEGITQKEQARRLKDFREGKYNILVGTSVSEEGLDIPSMDIAIFYEPVPSEIRNIQRRGRVGRHSVGKIIILVTKGTRDEAYYWSSLKKEKTMKRTLYGIKSKGIKVKKKTSLRDFLDM
ncbi:MAG TPA: DEAD/DEAH box helicase [Candidatus Aenigmarchaeota archaeon]|nr:MAG: hypothetical protein DRP03_00330 [Candidatus Aenigmarchaeota archaeon]HDD46431.1 DEAD/DEAH box helicase [Candidatus Aenigmarchaeota archaeon]